LLGSGIIGIGCVIESLFPLSKFHVVFIKITALALYIMIMLVGYVIRMYIAKIISFSWLLTSAAACLSGYILYCISHEINGVHAPLLSPACLAISTVGAFVVFGFAIQFEWPKAKIFGFIGAISYGMYLFHEPVIRVFSYLIGNPTDTTSSILFLTLIYGITIIVAALLHYTIEKPCISLGKNICNNFSDAIRVPLKNSDVI
jgi:peptidoglycan/LPS O-acetylase OafA/YrhL